MRLRELFEHKKGIRAKKYNKKPKKFIEPIKPKKAEAPHTTEDLDEGWKDWVAGAAIGAAALGASGDVEAAKKKHVEKPSITQQAKDMNKLSPDVAKKVAAMDKQFKAPSNIETVGLTNNNSEAEHTLQKVAVQSGIKGVELAQFMAQMRHETADFAHMKEIGGSLDFKKYDPKHAPKKAKILGNTKAGDGARYKGRGFIQITGRDNYRMAGNAIGLPLEAKPELASQPSVAAKVAVWYWKTRVKPNVQNFNDTSTVTKFINPGLRGLADRVSHFKDYKNILNIG